MIRSGTLLTLPAITAFAVGGLAVSAFAVAAMRAKATCPARIMDLGEFGARVLVIAAHPDDEVLATGGTIHRLIGSGAKVRVVIVTAGDSYRRAAARRPGVSGAAAYLALGEMRHLESIRAAGALGLAPSDLVSLGYADGTTLAMWDRCWDAVETAQGRNCAMVVPYSWAATPGAPLSGIGLASHLEKEIREFAPDTIITSDVHETHPDHAMTAAFAAYAMNAVGFRGLHVSDIVHFRHYPYPWAHLPAAALNPPPQLVESGTEWLALPLHPEDVSAKSRGIAEYRSQTEIADMGLYMRAFIRTNELFAKRAPARMTFADNDRRPAPGAAGTVAVTPRPVIAPAPGSRQRISSIRMTQGPRVLWVGLVCDRDPRPNEVFGIGLRLFGNEAPRRLDISVRGNVASPSATHADSIAPDDVRAEIDGATMWIAIPTDAVAGCTRCMIGAMVGPAGGKTMRTAWREVELQP